MLGTPGTATITKGPEAMCQCSQCNTTEEEAAHHYLQSAIENLISNQRQLDMDGHEVGVSREALETVLRHVTMPALAGACRR